MKPLFIVMFSVIVLFAMAVPAYSQDEVKKEDLSDVQIDGAAQSVNVIPHDVTLINDYLIVYDSSSANGRISKDSVVANLTTLGYTYDLFNKGTQSSTNVISFLGYKTIIWLGAGTSVMSVVQKDSIKAYLNSGTPSVKSKLIIFAEDIGYQFGRTGSTYLDLDFANNYLGFNYIADRPGIIAAHGLVGVTVNVGQTDSTIGTYPDILSVFDPAYGNVLYRFRNYPDSANSVSHIRSNFNVATYGTDVRSLRPAIDSPPGSPVTRFLMAAFSVVPVELVSFTASADINSVTLNWVTATETNNRGFEIEKLSDSEFRRIGYVEGSGTSASSKSYSFVDNNAASGIQVYRLKQIDFDGTSTYTPQVEVEVMTPKIFSLEQNYPNPFNPSTKINFFLSVDSKVTLKVFNILGQEIATLLNQNLAATQHSITFNAAGLNSGVYLYQIEAQGNDGSSFSDIKKMLLVK